MKVTGLETILLDNVPPYRGGRKWLFIKLHTDEGIVGLGERVTGGVTEPRAADRAAQRPVRAVRHRPEPVQRRADLAADVRDAARLSPPGHGPDAGDVGDRDRALGHHRQGDQPADLQPARRPVPREAARLRLHAVRGGLGAARRRPATSRGSWSTRAARPARSIRSSRCSRYPRDIPLKDAEARGQHLPPRPRGRRRRAGGRHRHAQPVQHGRRDPGRPRSSRSTSRSGSRSRCRRRWSRRWPGSPPRRASRSPRASGWRRSTSSPTLLEKQAAGIIQVDVGQCGGILESKKIAAIAEAHHALIAPHMYVGPIAAAAAIQLDTCSPNFMLQEFNVGPLHSEIFEEPIAVERRLHHAADRAGPGPGARRGGREAAPEHLSRSSLIPRHSAILGGSAR